MWVRSKSSCMSLRCLNQKNYYRPKIDKALSTTTDGGASKIPIDVDASSLDNT